MYIIYIWWFIWCERPLCSFNNDNTEYHRYVEISYSLEGCLNFSIFILKSLQKYSSQSNFKVYVFINSVWIDLLQSSYLIWKSSWWFFVMLNGQFALSCFSMRFNVFGGPLMSFFFINSYFVKFLSNFFTFLFLRCELSWMIPISECIRNINALTLLSQSSFCFLPCHINFVV